MNGIALRYGVGIGLVISVAMIASYLAAGDPPDFAMMEVVGYTSMILSLLAIVFGIRAERAAAGGTITFGRATKVGMGIAGVAALIVGLYTIVHIVWIDPDYSDKYIAYEEQTLIDGGATQAEVLRARVENEEMRELYENPLFQGAVMAGMVFGLGALITVVSGVVLKR